MFGSSTTQPPKIISPAATALAAEKTWLLQCLKALLRNLRSLSGQEGGLFQPKSVRVISYYSSFYYYYAAVQLHRGRNGFKNKCYGPKFGLFRRNSGLKFHLFPRDCGKDVVKGPQSIAQGPRVVLEAQGRHLF